MCFLISVQKHTEVGVVFFSLIILVVSTISFAALEVKEMSSQSILLLAFFLEIDEVRTFSLMELKHFIHSGVLKINPNE